ncbi:hypothetical protein [Paenibacillus bovis]|uniref:Uncharacterized protein n=1 Tax=Paenibacillus bovis TaxID=1616788 RepID=A0A172ZEY9_9BACL|nr:hypothetical protein [Paenibacillus bovis]ANF96089.1 hypothetical protein AR543_08815 [Paenibacillus bovis]
MEKTTIHQLQSRLQNGSLLSSDMWEQLDIERYLEYRDSADFDTAWIQAYQQLRREGLNPAEEEQVREWSRQAFDQVIRASGSSELAAYVSDDMDLVFCAHLLGLENEFIQELAGHYEQGELPV